MMSESMGTTQMRHHLVYIHVIITKERPKRKSRAKSIPAKVSMGSNTSDVKENISEYGSDSNALE